MANIVEGFVRHSDKEFVQFLFVAMASAVKVQSHLYVAMDQGYLFREMFDFSLRASWKDQQNHFRSCQISESAGQIDQTDEID